MAYPMWMKRTADGLAGMHPDVGTNTTYVRNPSLAAENEELRDLLKNIVAAAHRYLRPQTLVISPGDAELLERHGVNVSWMTVSPPLEEE